jgi:putative pyruvate formate lyase activating enzyme
MEAICLAVPRALSIPVVYNCGGYEPVETLRELEGVVDYLTDEIGTDCRLRNTRRIVR